MLHDVIPGVTWLSTANRNTACSGMISFKKNPHKNRCRYFIISHISYNRSSDMYAHFHEPDEMWLFSIKWISSVLQWLCGKEVCDLFNFTRWSKISDCDLLSIQPDHISVYWSHFKPNVRRRHAWAVTKGFIHHCSRMHYYSFYSCFLWHRSSETMVTCSQ